MKEIGELMEFASSSMFLFGLCTSIDFLLQLFTTYVAPAMCYQASNTTYCGRFNFASSFCNAISPQYRLDSEIRPTFWKGKKKCYWDIIIRLLVWLYWNWSTVSTMYTAIGNKTTSAENVISVLLFVLWWRWLKILL